MLVMLVVAVGAVGAVATVGERGGAEREGRGRGQPVAATVPTQEGVKVRLRRKVVVRAGKVGVVCVCVALRALRVWIPAAAARGRVGVGVAAKRRLHAFHGRGGRGAENGAPLFVHQHFLLVV